MYSNVTFVPSMENLALTLCSTTLKGKYLQLAAFHAIQQPLLLCYTMATSPDVKVWLNIILGDNLCMTNWNGIGHGERNFSLSIIKVFISIE